MEKELKRILMEALCRCGIITREFTGKLVFNINAGAICDVERTERLK